VQLIAGHIFNLLTVANMLLVYSAAVQIINNGLIDFKMHCHVVIALIQRQYPIKSRFIQINICEMSDKRTRC